MPRSPDPRTVTLRTPAGARGCLDENEVVEHCRGVNSAAARAEVELHLDRCAGCRELVSALVLGLSDEGAEVAAAATIAGPEPSAGRSLAGELAPPLRVGRYRIGAHVGSGGMGIVYAGHDPELGRTVALKLLAPRAGPDGEAQARLMLEAQAMARVSHPHVVAIHDVGVHEDRVWLAMEFIAGVTLAAWLRAQRRGWREVLAVFLAAGEGLAAVHAAGLVHRDFKPDNVMIDGEGRARVMDFGLSRVESAGPGDRSASPGAALAATTALTRTGALLGTPRYMAPEQWLGEVADARSDEFAFCVALWEALYGEAPFAGASQGELARSVGAGALRSPRADARVPGWLAAVLRRGLARAPEARFATMAELLAALRRDPTRRVRRRALLAGVGLLVGGLVLGSGVQRARHAAVCAAEANGLAEVWSPGLRAGLRERASASGDAGLVASTARTIERGDAYVAAWSEQRGRSCRAATVEGELDADTYGRVVACLEDGRAGLEVLVGELADADPRRVQRIGGTLAGLRGPGRCGEPEVLGRYAASAGLATTQAAQLRRTVARTSMLVFVGAFAAAQAELDAARAQARRLELPRLQALVELAGADLAYQRGDTREARARLIAAHAVAGAGGVDEVAAEAATFLAEVVGIGAMDPAGGEGWLRLAEMWQARLGVGPDDDRRFTLVRAHGRLRQARGDLAGAASRFERALAGARRLYGPAHPDVAALLMDLGVIATALGDHAGSYARMEAALAVLVAAHDPEHPQIGDAWFNLGSTRESIGDLGRANVLYRRALAIYTRAYGAEDGAVGETWLRIGTVELGRGDAGAAAAAFERARAIAEGEPAAQGELRALALAGLGAAELELHGARQALPLLERALARPEALAGDLAARASARFALARARAGVAADDPRAETAARAALRDLEEVTPPPRARVAEIEAWLQRRR